MLPQTLPRIFFFLNDTATTEIYTLSLHDALPICTRKPAAVLSITSPRRGAVRIAKRIARVTRFDRICRSEEHTSELQSRRDLVCRLLLEKKKIICVRYTHEAGRNTPNVSRSCYST